MTRKPARQIRARQAPQPDSAFHKKLLDGLHDGVYFVDCHRKITYWNRGAEMLTGYAADEAVGRHCFDNFLGHVDEAGCGLCRGGCPLQATMRDGRRREAEVYLRHKSGHRLPVSVRTAPIHGPDGKISGAVEVFSDLTGKKRAERRVLELEHLAFRDPLTGLANRRYTELKLAQALQEHQEFDRSFGLLMIDADHFKKVNDTHGHHAGDSALKAIAHTLALSLRPKDLVGRWGGEEFLVILADVDGSTLFPLAERSRKLIAASSVPVPGGRIQITVSLGATLFRRDDTPLTVLERADACAYASKATGRNQTTVG